MSSVGQAVGAAWTRAIDAVQWAGHRVEAGLAPTAGVVVLAGVAAVVQGQTMPQYTIEVLPGQSAAINDQNQVTMVCQTPGGRQVGGVYDLDTAAFRPLTTGLSEVQITDISDDGWVTGYVRGASGRRAIAVWMPDGRRSTPRAASDGVLTGPFINDSGRIVWGDGHGYTWAPGTRVSWGGSLTKMSRTMRDLTDDNMVMGAYGSAGVMLEVGGSGSAVGKPIVAVSAGDSVSFSEVLEGNDSGQVLISSVSSEGLRQMVWDRTSNTLTALSNPGAGRIMLMARAMNDTGMVVGAGIVPGVYVPEPMLWTGGSGYVFSELLGGAAPGWTGFLMPVDVNDQGVILGVGTYQGQVRWFVMRPAA